MFEIWQAPLECHDKAIIEPQGRPGLVQQQHLMIVNWKMRIILGAAP